MIKLFTLLLIGAIVLPPEIIDGIIALGAALLGWFARLISKKKEVEQIKTENTKLKEIVMEYDTAAKESLRYARKPPNPEKDKNSN